MRIADLFADRSDPEAFLDLVQVGNEALVAATDRYLDTEQPITYAAYTYRDVWAVLNRSTEQEEKARQKGTHSNDELTENGDLSNIPGAKTTEEKVTDRLFVYQAVGSLAPDLAQVVTELFGLGCKTRTPQEIADSLGVTVSRVSQMKKMALERLRYAARQAERA